MTKHRQLEELNSFGIILREFYNKFLDRETMNFIDEATWDKLKNKNLFLLAKQIRDYRG